LPLGSWRLKVGRPTHVVIESEQSAYEFLLANVGPVQAGATDLRVELVRGLPIAGRIEDGRGEAWTESGFVKAVPVSRVGDVGYETQRAVKVKPDGTFRIPGLPGGDYDVTVAAGPGTSAAATAAVVRVAAGTTGLVMRVSPGTTIAGRLVDDAGGAVEAKGWVWAFEPHVQPGAPGSVSAKLEAGGRFETPPLDPGKSYVVRAMGFAGFADATLPAVHPGDPDVVVRLRRGNRIEGRVLDPDGKPVGAGVPVLVTLSTPDPNARPDDGSYAFTTTDERSAFAVGGLRDGAFDLTAGGGASPWLSVEVARGVAAPASGVALKVQRGVAFSGVLVDGDGKGVPHAMIQARRGDGSGSTAHTRTDAEGRFAFVAVPAGTVWLGGSVGGKFAFFGTFPSPGDGVRVTLPESLRK
jgi:hypothetical protein